MSDCRHDHIVTYSSEDGLDRMWACVHCACRFYPACPSCVSIGHRGESHDPEWERHPFTCALCSWGRDGAYHSLSEYEAHMDMEHPEDER